MSKLIAIDPKGWGSLKGRPGYAVFNNGVLVETGNEPHLSAVCDTLVIELPQVYQHGRSKGDPNDLIRVAFYAGSCTRIGHGVLSTPTPAEWKGQTPKAICAERIKAVLAVHELVHLYKADHNVLDAVGIGLWALGRMPR